MIALLAEQLIAENEHHLAQCIAYDHQYLWIDEAYAEKIYESFFETEVKYILCI